MTATVVHLDVVRATRALDPAPSPYVLYLASRGPVSVSGDSYGQPVPYHWLGSAVAR